MAFRLHCIKHPKYDPSRENPRLSCPFCCRVFRAYVAGEELPSNAATVPDPKHPVFIRLAKPA